MRSTTLTAGVGFTIESVFGDEGAFRAWYEHSLPRVHRYLFHRCGRDRALAEDLTQETFLAALRTGRRLARTGDAMSWVIGIARHVLADHYRRLERRERLVRTLVVDPRPGAVMPPVDPDDQLSAALAALPAMQRAALLLRYLDDLSVRDIARLLGRSEKAVEALLRRGRVELRARYEVADA